jgi:hypothetical protein
MRNLRTIKTGLMLSALVFLSATMSLKAEEAPQLRVVVREASGKIVPLAGRIEMKDVRDPASGVVRTAAVDGEGTAVFRAEDFMGFMAAGLGKNGETKQVSFDGKSAFPQSQFKVQLTLNAAGYLPKKADIHVSVDSPMEYTFMLDSGNASTLVS